MIEQFRNLIFEGGGVKGIAYVGAMRVLEREINIEAIKRVGGTSAGAINALLFALGYDSARLKEKMYTTDFMDFMQTSWSPINWVGHIFNIAAKFGWASGDFFERWVGECIAEVLGNRNATFKDLVNSGRPELFVVATNLSTCFSEVFSLDNHPNMPIVKALRLSMSLPLIFTAKKYGVYQDIYTDGGVMRNYPIKLFDRLKYIDEDERKAAVGTPEYYAKVNTKNNIAPDDPDAFVYNRQTLGLRLDTEEEISQFQKRLATERKPIKNFVNYSTALVKSIMNAQGISHLHGDDWNRTIYVNTLKVKTADFNLTSEEKDNLIEQGEKGANVYFEWFKDPDKDDEKKNKLVWS